MGEGGGAESLTLAKLAVKRTHSKSSPILFKNSSTWGLFSTYTYRTHLCWSARSSAHSVKTLYRFPDIPLPHERWNASALPSFFPVPPWRLWLRAAFLNQVVQNRLRLSEQTYPGLLESGPDPWCRGHPPKCLENTGPEREET